MATFNHIAVQPVRVFSGAVSGQVIRPGYEVPLPDESVGGWLSVGWVKAKDSQGEQAGSGDSGDGGIEIEVEVEVEVDLPGDLPL